MINRNKKSTYPIFEKTLSEAFTPEYLRQTAKDTGLIKRERKIDPVAIFWVLALSFGIYATNFG